jgi:hypothetical protein
LGVDWGKGFERTFDWTPGAVQFACSMKSQETIDAFLGLIVPVMFTSVEVCQTQWDFHDWYSDFRFEGLGTSKVTVTEVQNRPPPDLTPPFGISTVRRL